MAASGDWDPTAALASVSSVGHGSWDPDPSAAPGSSIGRGSRVPDPSAKELPSSCRACGSGRSVTSTMLMASEVAAIYSSWGSSGSSTTITSGGVRYLLSSWNASSASLVHMKGPDFCSSLKNRRARSANLEINRLSAAKHPVSFCTSLMWVGDSLLRLS
jgi:hypothetical protein